MFLTEPEMTSCRMLAQLLCQALSCLHMGLFGTLKYFMPVLGTVLSLAAHFTATVCAVMGLPARWVHPSLGMSEDPNKRSWEVDVYNPSRNDTPQDTSSSREWTEQDKGDKHSDWLDCCCKDRGDSSEDVTHLDKDPMCSDSRSDYSSLTSEEEEETNSDWSDSDADEPLDDDGGDSDANTELWESFLCRDDPYNLLNFCSPSSSGDRGRCINVPQRPPPVVEAERSPCSASEQAETSQDCKSHHKKVQFSGVVHVHPLVAWRFASRAARDGSCWQEMARDRERFKRRIQVASDVISPCLLEQHRARVWERMQC